MNYCNHYELNSCVLETIAYDQEHTCTNLSTYFTSATEKWEFNNKASTIVTDNASNIVNAVEFSGSNSLKCAGHTLNLSAIDIINTD